MQDEKLFIKAIKFPTERILPSDLEGFDLNNPYNENLLEAYRDKRMSVFSDMDEWKEFDKNFDFYVGTRVHGAIAAINSGLPAIITNKDSRAEEMSSLFGIDWRDVDINDSPQELYQSISVDKMNNSYGALYDNFVEWLGDNDLTVAPKLSDKNNSKKENITSICKEGYEDNNSLFRAIFLSSRQNNFKINSIENKLNEAIGDIQNLLQERFVRKDEIAKSILFLLKEKRRFTLIRSLSRILAAFIIGKTNRKKFRNYIKKKYYP